MEQREGSGILFRNLSKVNDRQPDFTGEAMYEGRRIRLSAWEKRGKKVPFISLSLAEFTEERPRQSREPGDDGPAPF